MIKFKSSNSLQHIKGNISLEIVYQFNSLVLGITTGSTYSNVRAVVVAQLVEFSLPTQEVCGLNPVIGKNYTEHCFLQTVLKRQK